MEPKILVVRKMSSLEFYYNGNHESEELKESHEQHCGSIKKILEKLEDSGFQYKVVTRRDLTEQLVDDYNFVFSAGGDGTVIATAAFNKDKPQLNLRTDIKSDGKLCYHNIEQALENFLNEKYKIEEWTRQDIYLDGKFIGRALNETCIGEQLKFSKMARYKISVNVDGKPKFQKSSGIIIVTGTGSGGWQDAFDIYEKGSTVFKYVTIIPTKSGEGHNFKMEYKGHEGKFALDTVEYDLPRDSTLEIKLSKNPLKVISLKDRR